MIAFTAWAMHSVHAAFGMEMRDDIRSGLLSEPQKFHATAQKFWN